MTELYDYRFSVKIDDPDEAFRLASKYSPSGIVYGYDEKGRLRTTINLSSYVVICRGPRGGNLRRWTVRNFVKEASLVEHLFLVTLKWSSPGGWKGSPLELLALAEGSAD